MIRKICYIALILFLIVTIAVTLTMRSETMVFRRYVTNPIPYSVQNIRIDRPKGIDEYRYVFRFNINREDLNKIVASRPFIQVTNLKYNHYSKGHLYWEWDFEHGTSMIVYHSQSNHPEPEWFDLALWEDPESYGFLKVGNQINLQAYNYKTKMGEYRDTQVLIYNKDENAAYFIIDHQR